MSKRTLVVVVVAAAVLVIGAIALRAQGDGEFIGWFQRMHGR